MPDIKPHAVLDVLSRHIGKRNGSTAAVIARECLGHEPDSVDLRRLRKVIQQLRVEGHHICAHPATGYFIAETDDELDATCEFLYDRAMCSLKQISRMKKISLPDLRGQLRLPT